ncbi:hypothetical protein PC118_g22158 [Phytophthora cactorum]|uniref:Uncharacterized protein n=1 Tax=Phytophthora cactorum TaxID=29920 RepID=A0A8T1EU49_9STRA|nr:hypothetical protein PC118_g22158 [Phytophthora cactorum]
MNGRATDVAADEAEDNIPVLHVASTAASTPTIGSLPMGVCRLQLLPYRRRVAGEQSDRYTCGSGAVFWSFVCCVAWDVIVCAEVITAVGSSLVDVYSVTQPGWEAMNSAMVEKLFGKLAADAITVDRSTEMGTNASSVFALVPVQEQHQVDYRSSHPAPRADDRHMQGPLQLLYEEHHHGYGRTPRGNDRGRSAKRRFASPPAVAVARYYVMSTAAIGYGERQVLRTTKYPMDLDTGLILCVLGFLEAVNLTQRLFANGTQRAPTNILSQGYLRELGNALSYFGLE